MSAGSTSTIRTRIQWLVVACAVPVALLAVVLLVLSYQRGRDGLVQANLQAARALVQAVDRELEATMQVLQALTVSSDPQESADTLVALSNEAGGRDNITALVLHF